MAKFKKPEIPAISMTVDKGRLSPASARAQETMDQFRNGSVVSVYITQDISDWRRKRYFAVLTKAVKMCKTPWQTTKMAHEALKQALEVYSLGFTISGRPMKGEKSLNDLSEPEFIEYEQNAMDILHSITGVDPMTLGKEATSWDEPEPDADPFYHAPEEDSGPAVSAEDLPVAAPQPVADEPAISEGDETPSESEAAPTGSYVITEDDRELLVAAARIMIATTPSLESLKLGFQSVKAICSDHGTIHVELSAKLNKIKDICKTLCDKDAAKHRDKTLTYIAGIVGCDVRNLL